MNAEPSEQWRPLVTNELTAIVAADELDSVSALLVVVVSGGGELLEAGERFVLARECVADCVASMIVYNEQLIQLVLDAWGMRSSQVDVYCLQWPLAGACLSWDAVRSLCRVMLADRACVAVSV